ncbi:hypothetical protein CDAR_271281 [Caerostris darwini]|uniref:Uncharacterized protein n=1 Tax=Caerostris darwini TaxID=1538125 RepID=A0AAV4TD97_9ARAC|nr:hypothetical protein CDAR_271281 [Caerostris darwini]
MNCLLRTKTFRTGGSREELEASLLQIYSSCLTWALCFSRDRIVFGDDRDEERLESFRELDTSFLEKKKGR